MTHLSSGRTPGIGGYIVAGLVFGLAMAVFAAVMFVQIGRLGDDFLRMTVPGTHDLALGPGTYTIFHEEMSSPTGRVSSGTIDGLMVSVSPPGGGAAVPITPDRSSRYSLPRHAGGSLFRFTIEQAGQYRLNARYEDGRAEPTATLALARGFVGSLLGTIFTGLGIALGGAAMAGSIAFVTWRRRRAARRAAA